MFGLQNTLADCKSPHFFSFLRPLMKNIQGLKALIASPKHIVVITHFKPDADALGSSLGLAGFLKKKGHHVTVVTPSDYPAFLSWMPGNEEVVALLHDSNEPTVKAKAAIAQADIIFCLDFSSLKRIEDLEESVRTAPGVKVLVDHHLEPETFAAFEQWDPRSASTAGLIFRSLRNWEKRTSLMPTSPTACMQAS